VFERCTRVHLGGVRIPALAHNELRVTNAVVAWQETRKQKGYLGNRNVSNMNTYLPWGLPHRLVNSVALAVLLYHGLRYQGPRCPLR
jgi:hypothetical protein